MPRVITTINGFKAYKKQGEKSYPFDLCFSRFESNVDFLCNGFCGFYDGLEYDTDNIHRNCWINKKYNLIFNHDTMPQMELFEQRYDNRIKNLYEDIADTTKYLYFLIACGSVIDISKLDLFINEINKYRKINTFCVVFINQSRKYITYDKPNVFFINFIKDRNFKKMNKQGAWLENLRDARNINSLKFNIKFNREFKKILKETRNLWQSSVV